MDEVLQRGLAQLVLTSFGGGVLTAGPGGGSFPGCPSRQASPPGCKEPCFEIASTSCSSFAALSKSTADSEAGQLEIADACPRGSAFSQQDAGGGDLPARIAASELDRQASAFPSRKSSLDSWQSLDPSCEASEGPAEGKAEGCSEGQAQNKSEGNRQRQAEMVISDHLPCVVELLPELLTALSPEQWRARCRCGLRCMGSELASLGLFVNFALRESPTSLCVTVLRQVTTALLAHAPRQLHLMNGDLLPLPLGLSAEDTAAIDNLVTSPEMRSVEKKAVMELGVAAWLDSVVLALNASFCCCA